MNCQKNTMHLNPSKHRGITKAIPYVISVPNLKNLSTKQKVMATYGRMNS